MNSIINALETGLIRKFNTNNVFNLCKTKNGKTQLAEATYMPYVKEVFNELSLEYTEAPSQKSKDIRLKEPKINFEVKKTDGTIIFLNDTLPSKDIYYIYILTGTKKYKPQIKIINGEEFIKDNNWYKDYIDIINKIKNEFCRGDERKCKDTPLKCYLRPTWRVDLTYFNLLTN